MQWDFSKAALLGACAAFVAPAWSQTVTRLSVGPSGAQANGLSSDVRASSDGRWVVFTSFATNLVANDANGATSDVFLLDRNTGALELVSVDSAGAQGVNGSRAQGVSDNGRFVAFLSNGLDPGDTDYTPDVYLRDRQSGVTHWVSQENAAAQAFGCKLSRDGLTLGYSSALVFGFAPSYHVRRPLSGGQWDWLEVNAGGANGSFSRGVLAPNGEYVAVQTTTNNSSGAVSSVTTQFLGLSTGTTANLAGAPPVAALSPDASYLAYRSTNGLIVRHLITGVETVLIPGFVIVGNLMFSDDARYLCFESSNSDLVPGDTNNVSDIFVHDRLTKSTLRVNLSASGQQANGLLNLDGFLLGDGSRVLFSSLATNLVPGDTNGVSDVFERTNCFPYAADLDGDGYGSGAMSVMCFPVAPGFVLNTLDCDDTDPARSPGAPEVCNGVDDDCDGVVDEGFQGAAYCATSTSSNGCVPQIEALGSPRASATSGFTVRVTQMDGQRAGVLFYGLAPTALPWATHNPSTLCVAGARQRMRPTTSSGTPNLCDGVIARDVLAWVAATPGALATPFSAGTTLYFQGWLRDPLMPTGSILTGGWSTTLCP